MSAELQPLDKETLRQQLRALGFDDVRFAEVAPLAPAPHGSLRSLPAWLNAGLQADMAWLDRSLEKRLNPDLVLPGARSIIMLGVSYWSERLRGSDASTPRWARYALHEDYHDTVKAGLQAAGRVLESGFGLTGADYRYYVDTGPVIDRGWAARSGIGFIGKNGMLISREHGNWLFLAAVLTRVAIEPDPPVETARSRQPGGDDATRSIGGERAALPPAGLLCGKCTRCMDACPTAAFAEPGVVDSRRCVSYHTIENKGVIPRVLRAGIGQRVYGCDVCLEVCPWNRFAQEARRMLLSARHDIAELSLAELLALTPERFAQVFRRTPVKRLKLTGLLRNACVAAGNSGNPELLPAVLTLACSHESGLVRAHAVWAVHRLGGAAALAEVRLTETDPLVLAEYASEKAEGLKDWKR